MKKPKTILALSTLGGQSSVALSYRNSHWRAVSDNEKQVNALTALLKDVQKKSGCQWQDLDLIVCDIGPASLTGVRVGLSTVQGIALPYATPVWPCIHHEIQAYQYIMQLSTGQKHASGKEIWVAEDARMRTLSLAVYTIKTDGQLNCQHSPHIITPEVLKEKLAHTNSPPVLLGGGWQRYEDALAIDLPPAMKEGKKVEHSLAEAMVALACVSLENKPLTVVSAQALKACYLRPPV